MEKSAEEGEIEPLKAARRRGGCVGQAECAHSPLLLAVALRPSSDTIQDPSCGGARVHLRAPPAGRRADWSRWTTHLRRGAPAYTRASRRRCQVMHVRPCPMTINVKAKMQSKIISRHGRPEPGLEVSVLRTARRQRPCATVGCHAHFCKSMVGQRPSTTLPKA